MNNTFHINNKSFELSFQTSATTFNPAIAKSVGSGQIRWDLSGGIIKTSNSSVALSHTFVDNSVKTVKMQYDNPSTIGLINFDGISLIGHLDLSKFINCYYYYIGNNNLTSVTFGYNSNVFDLHIYNNPKLKNLVLTGLTSLEGNILIYNNNDMSGITFPINYKKPNQLFCYNNSSLKSLDLSSMKALGGNIRLNDNSNLTGITLPNSPCAITYFYAYNNPKLKNLVLTGLTGLGGNIFIYNNTDMSGLTFPIINNTVSSLYCFENYALSSLDLSGMKALGGDIRLYYNINITGLTLPNSPCAITYFDASNNPKLKNLILTGLTGLGGNIYIKDNSIMTGLTFPTSYNNINAIWIWNTSITTLDLSGMKALGGDIRLQSLPYLSSLTLPNTPCAITYLILNNITSLNMNFGTFFNRTFPQGAQIHLSVMSNMSLTNLYLSMKSLYENRFAMSGITLNMSNTVITSKTLYAPPNCDTSIPFDGDILNGVIPTTNIQYIQAMQQMGWVLQEMRDNSSGYPGFLIYGWTVTL